MGWGNIPKPKSTPPGQWEAFEYGGHKGWILRCPPSHVAHITLSGGQYYLELNSDGKGPRKTLEVAQIDAETFIVSRIKEGLPVYKLLVERLEARRVSNIVLMKPKDGA
jgi:hypothetical protein